MEDVKIEVKMVNNTVFDFTVNQKEKDNYLAMLLGVGPDRRWVPVNNPSGITYMNKEHILSVTVSQSLT